MKLTLPPGMPVAGFDAALKALAAVVGKNWVLATDDDRETYVDPYAAGDGARHAPSAAVAAPCAPLLPREVNPGRVGPA